MHDDAYPPKNRMAEELPILELQVEHADGRERFDPNRIKMWAIGNQGSVLGLSPLDGRVSDVSGDPAVVYRGGDVELALSPDELLRLIENDLRPEEFFALRARYGIFHEIHDDFYDPVSGYALQPMHER